MTQPSVKRTAWLGAFLGLALILSYVESLIPFYFGVPGLKLGLTNLVVLVMLYRMNLPETFLVSLARILLAGILFGNPFSILYSLGGGMLSLFGMYALKKSGKFRLITVSMAGGFLHNLGQITVASLVVSSRGLYFYFPVLALGGMLTGFLIGILAREVLRRVHGFGRMEGDMR